jgi:hypothetical protein
MPAGSRKLKMTMIAVAAALAYARLRRSAALTRVSKTAILCDVFCLSVVAQSAKLSFTHLSVADGLSHADVRSMPRINRDSFVWDLAGGFEPLRRVHIQGLPAQGSG